MIWGIVFALAVTLCITTVGVAKETTITGEVNDNYQVVSSDGKIYEVADTAKGNELVTDYVSKKVKVTGTVEKIEEEDAEMITVTHYTVITNE